MVSLEDPGGHTDPGRQGKGDANVEPEGQNAPAWHKPLQEADERPELDPYRPALQLVQLLAPGSLNVPAVQMNAAGVEVVEPAWHA